MIQRKQTLFLLQSAFLSISLMFIPSADVIANNLSTPVYLIPSVNPELQSTFGHFTAIALNFVNLLLCFAAIFLYRKRQTQVKLGYTMIFIWVIIAGMLAFCPFIENGTAFEAIVMNYLSVLVAAFGIIAVLFAIRFIKKDIALLKSADRIR